MQSIDSLTAAALLASDAVDVVDVRTPHEFEQLGHIPGATLLPVHLIASGAATLPNSPLRPLLMVCEHGIRSVQAARYLEMAGFSNILNLSGGMAEWTGPREFLSEPQARRRGPSSWLVENAGLLPPGGWVLDLACGFGRHALLLAAAGFRVRAVDRDVEKIESLKRTAGRIGLALEASVEDVEIHGASLGVDVYDAILVFRYLHRPLFPALKRALRPGGILLYETFTVAQARRGKPTNPDFLLEPGELCRLVAPLEIEHQREGEFDGACLAGVVARKKRS